MLVSRLIFCAALALVPVAPAVAKMTKEKDRVRAQAEHDCYNDAQRLGADAVPDEDKITACFAVKRTQLSPACRKVYDQGINAGK